jgi:hypothetical protein
MLLAGLGVSAWIDNAGETGAYLGVSREQLGALCLAGFAAGCIVGRWQAVLLAVIPVLVAIPFGRRQEADGIWVSTDLLAVDMAGLAVVYGTFIAAGIAVVAVARSIRHPESAPLRWMSAPAKLFALVAAVGLAVLILATLDELIGLAIWNGDYWPAWGERLDGSYASDARATYGDFAAQVGIATGIAALVAYFLVADSRHRSNWRASNKKRPSA